MTVAKLTAILRMASSLDRSNKQKFAGIKATLAEDELVLTMDSMEDISLEKRFFEETGEFFREVFSVQPILRQKKKF